MKVLDHKRPLRRLDLAKLSSGDPSKWWLFFSFHGPNIAEKFDMLAATRLRTKLTRLAAEPNQFRLGVHKRKTCHCFQLCFKTLGLAPGRLAFVYMRSIFFAEFKAGKPLMLNMKHLDLCFPLTKVKLQHTI